MVANDKVVSMKYTLKNDKGDVLDQSGTNPLSYLHGHGNIIPGLEKGLDGLAVGDHKQVVVAPAEGYGEHQEEKKFELPRSRFEETELKPGVTVVLETKEGKRMMARVAGVEGDVVKMDANHPLAGQTLHFDVEIVEIRDAGPEELAHGHVHGPGGHHH